MVETEVKRTQRLYLILQHSFPVFIILLSRIIYKGKPFFLHKDPLKKDSVFESAVFSVNKCDDLEHSQNPRVQQDELWGADATGMKTLQARFPLQFADWFVFFYNSNIVNISCLFQLQFIVDAC